MRRPRQRGTWTAWMGRSWVLHAVMLLLGLGPVDAAAELPLLSLPSVGVRPLDVSLLFGTRAVGVGASVPIGNQRREEGGTIQNLVLEVSRGHENTALGFDVAYHWQLTPLFVGGPCELDREKYGPREEEPDEEVACETLLIIGPRDFNVAAQLGLHVRTATPGSDEAGVGPALGFSMSRWFEHGETFLGVQGAPVLSPASGRLEVPVRASIGLRRDMSFLRFMLVARGGWDNLRQGIDERLVADASLTVGLTLFD